SHRGKNLNYDPLCVPRAWAQRLCLISYATIYVPFYVCHVSHADVIHPERSSRRRKERTEEKKRKKKKSKEKGKKSHCKINSGKNLYYVMRCMWWMFIRKRYVQYIYLCISKNIIFFIYISIMR